jgi:hypothetical protein
VGKVIIQKLGGAVQLEKSGQNTILPMQISNVQMINVYNQHQNLREEVNKRIAQKFKLNYLVDTFVYPNIGVHIINKSDELLKINARKDDVDIILNRESSVQTSENSVTFFVKIDDYLADLKSEKNKLFLERLVQDLSLDKNIIYEFLKDPVVYADKIVLSIDTDFWQVASNRIKNSILGRVGEILANLIKSDKLDKEVLTEVFKTVVLKVMKLKDYDEKFIRENFYGDKNIETLKEIRNGIERHFMFSSTISEFLAIHRELLFVINKEKETNHKSLSHIGEFQFFIMILVNTLIRENISAATSLSSDDRGGYSDIINNIFFEGLRDIKHPGRMDIIKYVAQIFETIDYDVIHYNLTDMQIIVQRFHGVNLAELNSNKNLVKRLRADRDKLKNQLLIVNKYIAILFKLDESSQDTSKFMRYFSDSNNNSSVSLRYVLNGLKSKGFSFKVKNIDDIITYVEEYLSNNTIKDMLDMINKLKSIITKNTKEWVELKDNLDMKAFNIVQKKLLSEPIDFTLKQTSSSISIDRVETFLSLLKDFKSYFQNSMDNGEKDFLYKDTPIGIEVKVNSNKIDKNLQTIVDKLTTYFDYFDSCDIRVGKNIDTLHGKRDENGDFRLGLIAIFYSIFDNSYKVLGDRIKRIRNTTGYQSKVNIDNFYTLVKRIVNYYMSNHILKYPLSNKPLLLPAIEIPPTHIEVIMNLMEQAQEGSVEKYFGEEIESKDYEEFMDTLNKFFTEHGSIDDNDRKTILLSVELYYQAKKEELIEKQNLLKDNEFKVPDRIINPYEGLKKTNK